MRQSTGTVMANICTDTVTAPGVLMKGKVAMVSTATEVWALLSVLTASVSGNYWLVKDGFLVNARSSAVSTLRSQLLSQLQYQLLRN